MHTTDHPLFANFQWVPFEPDAIRELAAALPHERGLFAIRTTPELNGSDLIYVGVVNYAGGLPARLPQLASPHASNQTWSRLVADYGVIHGHNSRIGVCLHPDPHTLRDQILNTFLADHGVRPAGMRRG